MSSNLVKITKKTIAILQNFSTINQSLCIQPTGKLYTVAINKSIIGKANIEEKFPREFAIYDLSEFLGSIALFDNPTLDFGANDNYVVISGENSTTKIKYYYASIEIFKIDKDITMPITEVGFYLKMKSLQSLMKAANVLQLNDIVITPKNGEVDITATNDENPTSNDYSLRIETDVLPSEDFKFVVHTEALKMIPADYDIGISSQKLAHFYNENIEYWIALLATSTYGE